MRLRNSIHIFFFNRRYLMVFLLTVLIATASFSVRGKAANVVASGDCGASGSSVTWILDSDGKLVIRGNGEMRSFSKNKAPWYDYSSVIKSITIESGVTSIGSWAFAYCVKVESVSIPNTVISIQNNSLFYCTGLLNVTIPSSVKTIGESAFHACKSLKSVEIPNSVSEIGERAFCECYNLMAIRVDAGNNNYVSDEQGCLYNKSKTTLIQYPIGNKRSAFTIPNTVSIIGYSAFFYCKYLTNIIIPNNVVVIDSLAFCGCEGLKSITIPKSVSTIGYSSFAICNNLTAISVQHGNKEYMSDETGCLFNKSLTVLLQYPNGRKSSSFTIPNYVKTVGKMAFVSCNLSSVTIPNSVNKIEEGAFYKCESLRTVEILNTDCQIGNNAFLYPTTLYSFYGSTAQAYAKENNLGFSEIVHTHSFRLIVVEQEATCSLEGRQYQVCTVCGQRGNEKTISRTAHSYKTKTVAATMKADGKVYEQCAVCNAVGKTVGIPKVSSIKLSKTVYSFTGKAKTPSPVIQDRNQKKLEKNKDYKVKYSSGRIECGSYNVKIVFKGRYAGKKTLTFKIVPGKVTGLKQTPGKGIRFSWNAVKGATVYDVEYYDKISGNFYPLPSKKYPNGYTVTQAKGILKSGTEVTVRVRAVYITQNGKRIAGKYSETLTMIAV